MKSLFDQMGGTYHQEGDYLIPNLTLPDEPEYQIGKYGRMRRSYLKAHRPVLYANFLTSGRYIGTLPRLTKPATSIWKSSFLLWQSKKVRLKPESC